MIDIHETPLGQFHNPLWQDDDWNLVGNPYPCAIDLDLFIEENDDVIINSFYFWVDDNQNGTDYHHSEDYATFINNVGTTANGGTAKRYVAAGQAFWVYAKSDATIKFTNLMRVAGNTSHLFKTEEDLPPFVYLTVSNDSNNNNQCAVGFNDTSTDDYDEASDAPKSATGTSVVLASYIDTLHFAIQALEMINENEAKSVPLYLTTSNPGVHVFSVDSFQNMGGEYEVYLKDHQTGVVTNLKTNDYSLFLATGNYSGRFSLEFENNGTPLSIDDGVIVNAGFHAYQMGEEIFVQLELSNSEISEVFLYDIAGKQITYSGQSGTSITLDGSSLNAGVYVIKAVLDDGEEISVKIPFSK
jgi:hypothetical protein